MSTVLVLIPALDSDPTEVAVPWKVLTGLGHRVVFATPDGRQGNSDDIMVTGRGLDVWGRIPGLRRLVVVGRFLRADAVARAAYVELERAESFRTPIAWEDIDLTGVDAVILPGGHRARGMRPYLESTLLQACVVEAFDRSLPVGAICHGALLAARSIDERTGRSVLWGRRTTALTWALERRAWRVGRVTRFWDRGYYRTYEEQPGQPEGFMSVQQEVSRALREPSDFVDVNPGESDARRKASGLYRDRDADARPALVVTDGLYVSARWPGDAHTFAHCIHALLAAS